MGWRYGACQRTYKTLQSDMSETIETVIELVEVFPGHHGYTEGPGSIVTDTDDGKDGLVKWLQQAAKDVANNELIIDPDVVRTDLRK